MALALNSALLEDDTISVRVVLLRHVNYTLTLYEDRWGRLACKKKPSISQNDSRNLKRHSMFFFPHEWNGTKCLVYMIDSNVTAHL